MSTATLPDLAPLATLDYAQRPKRLYWLRAYRRYFIGAALVVALALLVRQGWPAASRYVRWHYWHWQLAHYSMEDNPETVLVDEAARVESRRSGSEYVFTASKKRPSSDLAVFCPQALQGLIKADFHLHKRLDEDLEGTPVIRFICQRTRPDGTPRTLLVRWCGGDWDRLVRSESIIVIGSPGWLETPRRDPVFRLRYPTAMCGGLINASADETALAIDPANPGRVRLTAIMHSHRGNPERRAVLLGTLTDDDRTVWKLESYVGPAGGEPYVDPSALGQTDQEFEQENRRQLLAIPLLAFTPTN